MTMDYGAKHLGHKRRGATRHIKIRLAGHVRDGLEIGALAVVGPFLLGDCVRLSSDDKVERIGANVTPRLGSEIQQAPGMGRGHRDVVVAPNELIIPIGRAELHPTIRQPGADERHVACLRTRGEATIVQGEKLAGEVRVAGGPQLPQDGDVFAGIVITPVVIPVPGQRPICAYSD